MTQPRYIDPNSGSASQPGGLAQPEETPVREVEEEQVPEPVKAQEPTPTATPTATKRSGSK
jgi:hypothetical protein